MIQKGDILVCKKSGVAYWKDGSMLIRNKRIMESNTIKENNSYVVGYISFDQLSNTQDLIYIRISKHKANREISREIIFEVRKNYGHNHSNFTIPRIHPYIWDYFYTPEEYKEILRKEKIKKLWKYQK